MLAMNQPSDLPPPSPPSTLTRRGLITGGLAIGATVAAGDLLSSDGAVAADTRKLDSPGKALQAAQRMMFVPDEEEIIVAEDEEPTALPDGVIMFPIEVGADDYCAVLDNFGDCRGAGCSRSHEGVDIMADHRLPIVSVAAGVITKTYVDSGKTHGAGNGWTIYSADTNITWKYFHMDDFAEGLEEGDAVEQGQVIGYVGNTGTSGALSDRNYHLHFEYRPGNVARDSYSMLERAENVTFY